MRMVLKLVALLSAVGVASACGSDSKKTTPTTTAKTYTFATDVAPLVKTYCADSKCHGKTNTGAGATVYEDNETNFKAEKASIKAYMDLPSGSSNFMPRDKTIPAEKKQIIFDYLGN